MEWPSLFTPDTQVWCLSKKPPLFREHVFFWSLSLPLPPLSVLWQSQCAWALSDHPFSFMTENSADYVAPYVWHPYFFRGCMAFRRCNKRQVIFFFAAGLAEGTCEVKGGVDIVAGQLLYLVKLEERKRACSEKKKGIQDVQTNALSRQCAGMCCDKTSSNCEMDSQESIKVPSQHIVSSKFCWRNARTQMIKMSFHSWLLNSPQCFYLMMNLQGVNRETGEWKLLLRNTQKQP